MKYTAAEKLKEIKREIAMRRRVYPGLIARGSMSFATGERYIEIMRQIAEDYEQEAAEPNLFAPREA